MVRLVAAALLVLLAGPAHAASPAGPEQLIGVWRGTSICTDRVAAPACRDETVVYEFTAGSPPGTVHWAADKVVNGQRERMGELELAYDTAEACWKAEFSSPRLKSVWCLSVSGARLSGTARLLPGNETVRRVELRKESPPAPSRPSMRTPAVDLVAIRALIGSRIAGMSDDGAVVVAAPGIAEIEAASLAEMRACEHYPQVAFGHANAHRAMPLCGRAG